MNFKAEVRPTNLAGARTDRTPRSSTKGCANSKRWGSGPLNACSWRAVGSIHPYSDEDSTLAQSNQLEVVRGLLAFARVSRQFERNFLTFGQRAEAGSLDGANVDEHIRVAILGLNEAEALLGI